MGSRIKLAFVSFGFLGLSPVAPGTAEPAVPLR